MQGYKGRGVFGVKPVGESYSGLTIQKMARDVHGANDYLLRDFDFPKEITRESEFDADHIAYSKTRIMKNLRQLSDIGVIKLGVEYDRYCAFQVASVNDKGSNIVKMVELNGEVKLSYVNKCASSRGLPPLNDSKLQFVHCAGHSLRLFQQGPVMNKVTIIGKIISWLKYLRSESGTQVLKNLLLRASIGLNIPIKPLTPKVEQRMFK